MKYTTTTTNPATIHYTDSMTRVYYIDPNTGRPGARDVKSAQLSAAAIEKALTAAERSRAHYERKTQPTEYKPTTCTALVIIDQRAARIRAAAMRHALPELDTIQAPEALPLPTDADRAAALYATSNAAGAVCLRARDHSGHGNQRVISDLRRAYGQDATWSKAADMATVADTMRAQAEQERELAKTLTTEADKLDKAAAAVLMATNDRDKLHKAANMHRKAAHEHNEAAKRLTAEALDIDKHLQTLTASDREDIVHAAAIAVLACTYTDTETDVFRAACAAAGRVIDAHRAARAGGYKTKVYHMGDTISNGVVTRKATAAENVQAYEDWNKKHANAERVPFSVRGGASAGYYTTEYRDTKTHPDGYYRIAHYVTETAAELTAAMDLTKPQRVSNVDVTDIIRAAGLPSRQRAALALLTIATGAAKPTSTDPAKLDKYRRAAALIVKAGRDAERAHDAETAAAVALLDSPAKRQRKERDRAKIRNKARAAAMLDKALTIAGVPESQLPNQRKAIRDKLTAALDTIRKTTTSRAAAPAALDVLKMWSEAAKATEDSRHPYPGHVASLTYTSTTTGRAAALDMVWSTSYDPSKAESLTPAQLAQEAAEATAAEIAHQQSHAAKLAGLTLRRALRDHQRGARTVWPELDAMTAAAVFFPDSMPLTDWEDIGRAILAEQAAAKAAEQHSREIIRAAQRVTLDAWRKMSRAEKDATIAMLNS